MRITLESTTRIVEVELGAGVVPGRIWEGETDTGIRVVALITRIAAETADRPEVEAEFRRELEECKEPTPGLLGVYPARVVL